MKKPPSFQVETPVDFYEMVVKPQYEDFLHNNSSSRHAILTIISAYHLYEWVNNKKFTVSDFKACYPKYAHLAKKFDTARHIANGNKHYVSNSVKTFSQKGFSSAFSDAFARPLNIIFEDGSTISVDKFLNQLMDFWESQRATGSM